MVFISDIIVKKDKYGPDYYWIIGLLRSGVRVVVEDIFYNLQKYIGCQTEMLLSFMRSPYLELQRGIHNQLFLSEEFYSVDLIDELVNKSGSVSSSNEREIILKGEYIDSYTIPEEWTSLLQRRSFRALFNEPSAFKTQDGTYLLYPIHSKIQTPIKEISQEIIMVGSLRLEAWHLFRESSSVNSYGSSR